MTGTWHLLPVPATWRVPDKRAFTSLARILASPPVEGRQEFRMALDACQRPDEPGLGAAAHVLTDLFRQGWAVRVDDAGQVLVSPPEAGADPGQEKDRVRRQELLKRDEQLLVPSVRNFIASMERPREFRGHFVSIFSLMRDGRELKTALEVLASRGQEDLPAFRAVIDPYIQVVNAGERCRHTGLRLTDVWRYFRHTWTNQYTNTPGRTMLILVRDRAAPLHPVIGIAALSSAVVQISERDNWIGWQPQAFLAGLAANPTLAMARWVVHRLENSLGELYLDDLLQDGLYWPSLWDSPTGEAIDRLEKEAKTRRRDHHRFARQADFKRRPGADDPEIWTQRARSDLFRSKRCLVLAELLRARAALNGFLYPTPSSRGLKHALSDVGGQRALAGILRRAKAESVGTEIADLTVCGAVAPYNSLLGGKLIAMLAVSPSVIRAYRDKYSDYASEIASGMAGRPIRRRTNLVFIGTTSLYGSGSSQYNRVRIPAEVLAGQADIRFQQLGRSRSFGTSHLSADSVTALVRLAEQSSTGVRVNSIFGEGVNPKLRKVRHGLDLLGWPSDQLLQHGRQRIVYGVSLVRNLLPYLLAVDVKPGYVFPRKVRDDVAAISQWWIRRWLARRIGSAAVLEAVSVHQLDRPVSHGARVIVPDLAQEENLDVSG
jgi:Domain of unknown function (DUF4338)